MDKPHKKPDAWIVSMELVEDVTRADERLTRVDKLLAGLRNHIQRKASPVRGNPR